MSAASRVIRPVKRAVLNGLRHSGALRMVGDSSWRRRRLTILCFHGLSFADEHLWNGGLYIPSALFTARLEALRALDCSVLPLAEGLERLQRGSLPPRSVVLTFDDGMADFPAFAQPELARFGYPATVYLTSYYCEFNRPIFRIYCSYLLWQRRDRVIPAPGFAGLDRDLDLRRPEARAEALLRLDRFSKQNDLSGAAQDELAQRLAETLGVDDAPWRAQRRLHVMTPDEAGQMARAGIDIQLHTHRHRTPRDAALFAREIHDNHQRIVEWTGRAPEHFCYPSGVHYPEFVPWLAELGVRSATTCLSGLAEAAGPPLLLPRILDHVNFQDYELDAWLSGFAALLPRRQRPFVDPEADREVRNSS